MSFELLGLKELQAKLEAIAAEAPREAAVAVYQSALPIMKRSMQRTPVDIGVARASHELSQPKIDGSDIGVTISVGGAAEDYIVPLHENLQAHHEVGEAKFLERSIYEAAPTFPAEVAKRIDLNRMAG